MDKAILLIGLIILICILMNKFLDRIPIPSLLIFIGLGICFGENGFFRIRFNDYNAVNIICSICLIFIMFYGGFNTNIKSAKSVLVQSVLLSTIGVLATAIIVAIFSHIILGVKWIESFLIGGVISSTDAATTFNILKANKLALKYNSDSMLEVESGSNDPMSYMLTTVFIALMSGDEISIGLMLVKQITFGVVFGVLIGIAAVWLMNRTILHSQEARTVFLFAIMLLAFAVPSVFGGNGYLSVYLCGIWIGNNKLTQKRYLVHFFNVITDIAQVIIFFLLGLLVTPMELPSVIIPAFCIMIFLTIIARPIVISGILAPFKSNLRQIGLVSWAGLRGAASIVFAISVVLSGVKTQYNLYNLVFCIVLLSVLIQGSFLPKLSEKLLMIDKSRDIEKTFNDYQEESDVQFIKLHLDSNHSWCNSTLSQITLPSELLVVMIVRNNDTIIPSGDTVLKSGDLLVFAAKEFEGRENLLLCEHIVEKNGKFANLYLSQLNLPSNRLVVLIKRGTETIIPTGNILIKPNDVLVIAQR